MRLNGTARCGVATRPATPRLSSLVSRERQSGMRPSPVNCSPRLGERQVRRREDHVGLLEHVVGDGLAVAADELEQRLERRLEALLVAGLDRRHDLVVELVELVGVLVGDLVLPLGGDPDDHAGFSCGGRGRAPASPDSERLRRRRGALAELGPQPREVVVDRRRRGQLVQLAVDVVLPRGERELVVERAGGLELVHRVGAGTHVLGLVDRPLHRHADVGHLLAHAGRGLGDLHGGLGGGVLRLDDLLLGAELVDLGAQLLLLVDQRLLLGLELLHLRVERPAARSARTACARARRARDPRGSARAPAAPGCRA